MNEEIEELGIIIQDFSAVSEWEIFVVKIEEAFKDWKLSESSRRLPRRGGDASRNDSWRVRKEKINYGADEFLIARYELVSPSSAADDEPASALDDADDSTNARPPADDFARHPDDVPACGAWFGLDDFVVLIPAREITDESKIKLALSSVSMAIGNTGCETAVFVQCREEWQRCYLGARETRRGLCTKYDTVHLRNLPAQCHHLAGLLDLFKGKIASTIALDAVSISARFSYGLERWPSSSWRRKLPEFDLDRGSFVGLSDGFRLPFGAREEPIKRFALRVKWTGLSDDTVVDSQTYTDFDPLQASEWSVSAEMVDEPKCSLYAVYAGFMLLGEDGVVFSELLSDSREFEVGGNSLFPAPKPILPAISKLNSDSDDFQNKDSLLPLCYELVIPLLKFVFSQDKQTPESAEEKQPFSVGEDQLKADITNGLVWRLAVASAYANLFGCVDGVGHLWYEFCQELRYRWENLIPINGIMDGFPNSRTCLLHQKLQMLNICIDRRKRRDEAAKLKAENSSDDDEDEDDEFYECEGSSDTQSVSSGGKKYAPWNKPAGRLGKFGNMTLINSADEPLYVPMTQEPVPKTEDQIEEDAEAMLNLGTDKEASEIRATIMSASLLSDMDSFKAANPDGAFEDFIRWYSPKDWIVDDEDDRGRLSTRMKIPDNIWIQVWNQAKMVPAKRQRRLFDDTTEAEKMLHFLETRNSSQIAELLIPSLTHAVLSRLGEECRRKPEIRQLEKAFEHAVTSATKLTRERAELKKYETYGEQIYKMELALSQLMSLRLKFCDNLKLDEPHEGLVEFLGEMLRGEEARIAEKHSDYIRMRICSMFADGKDVAFGSSGDEPLGKASEKEFVLRVMARRPSSTSTPSPQMMRAILRAGEYRLLGAFTEDVIFT